MPMRSTTTEKISIEEVVEVATESPKLNSAEIPKISSKMDTNESFAIINALNTTNGESVKSEKVEKSTQSIKTILIGLLLWN